MSGKGLDRMMYDLVERPWIEVRGPARVETLGLEQVLLRAHELREVLGDMPTTAAAVTRLLAAVLARALHTAGISPAQAWQEPGGALPAAAVTTYLAAHRDRFDLYHPAAPFMQTPGLAACSGEVTPVTRLIADVPAGKPFITTRAGAEVALSAAEAARWLVHVHAYDVNGIKTGMAGDVRVKRGKGYPIGPGWSGQVLTITPQGPTLAATLLMHLPAETRPGDLPPWERPVDGPGPRTHPKPSGPVDVWTWQTRRVRLVPDPDGRVRGALLGIGDPLIPEQAREAETHALWRESGTPRRPTVLPVRADPDRELWELLPDLLTPRPSVVRPAVLDTAAACPLPDTTPITLTAVGAQWGTQRATVSAIDASRLRVPLAALRRSETARALAAAAAATASGCDAYATLARTLAVVAGDRDGLSGRWDRAAEHARAEITDAFAAFAARLNPHRPDPAGWYRQARALLADLGEDLVHQATTADPGITARARTDPNGKPVTVHHARRWFHAALDTAFPTPEGMTA